MARFGVIAIVVVAFTALFFGRRLQREYPWLIELVAMAGLGLAVVVLSIGIYCYRRSPWSSDPAKALVRVLPLATAMVLAYACCETMILLPIERIHFLKYAALAALVPIACVGFYDQSSRTSLEGFLIAATVGMTEECLQYFVPERFFDLRDIALNVTGALLGTVIAWLIRRPYMAKSSNIPETYPNLTV